MRLEGSDFKENLPGLWEGNWSYGAGRSDIERIKIIKIDGNKVHLTGWQGGGGKSDTDEVYGVITAANKVLTFRAISRVQSNGTGDFSNLLFGQIAQR
jgi:hypothetical protein